MSDAIKAYPYVGVVILEDGREEVLDLEEHGWADKARMAATRRFTLVPKSGSTLPVVSCQIPAGAKPIFKSRAFGQIGASDTGSILFRCYALGYKIKGMEHLMWVLPNGGIEMGVDPLLADLFLPKQNA